ncbi:MAG: MFS transporter [Eubacterium sp.]
MVEKVKGKLSPYIKFSYGFADVGFQMMVTLSNSYLLIFFTDVAGISAVTAGIIMTVGRIMDTISVPILGPFIEKSNLPWGKYRSWLFIGALCIFVTNIILFVNLSFLPQMALIILGAVVYAIFCISTNVAYIGYTSMNSSLTDDPEEKVQLSTFRGQGAAIGKILAGWTLIPLIYFFGGASAYTEKGFLMTAILVGLMIVFTYLNLFYATKEHKIVKTKEEQHAAKGDNITVMDMIKQIFTTRPLLLLFLSDVTRILASLLVFSMFPYFFKYVVHDPAKVAVFFGSVNILLLVGATLVPFITKKLSKRATYMCGNAVMAVCFVLMFLNNSNPLLVTILASVGYLGYALGNVVNTAMYADIVDFGEYKTGKNARAAIFSVFQLSIKVAAVFSTSIAAFGLALTGFQAGVEPTAQVVSGINNISMLLPAGLLLAGVIFLYFYNIKEKELPEMRAEIANRKK